MTQVTIHEAKTHHSRLIKKVLQGEEVVIAMRDQPLGKDSSIKSDSLWQDVIIAAMRFLGRFWMMTNALRGYDAAGGGVV